MSGVKIMVLKSEIVREFEDQSPKNLSRIAEKFKVTQQHVSRVIKEYKLAQQVGLLLKVLLREVDPSKIQVVEFSVLNNLMEYCRVNEVKLNE